MDNFYTWPDLCLHLKKNGLSAPGTLIEQEDFPLAVKEANLKQGEHICPPSQTVMVIKWMDKKQVHPSFHSDTMVPVLEGGKALNKPRGTQGCNSFMGGEYKKDKKLQP